MILLHITPVVGIVLHVFGTLYCGNKLEVQSMGKNVNMFWNIQYKFYLNAVKKRKKKTQVFIMLSSTWSMGQGTATA